MLSLEFERRMEKERNRAKDLAEADCREFFCHMATDFYVAKMVSETSRIEDELLREAVCPPLTKNWESPVFIYKHYWVGGYSKQAKNGGEK